MGCSLILTVRAKVGWLLAIYIALLVTMSLYPWQIEAKRPFLPWYPLGTRRLWADVAGNVWLYALFGALVWMWLRNGWRSVASTVVIGGAVSAAMEFAQQWIPGRYSTGIDLTADTFGAAMGAGGSLLIHNNGARLVKSIPPIRWDAAILLMLWALWIMFPFVPVFQTWKLYEAQQRIVHFTWHWAEAMQGFAGFAILAVALRSTFWRAIAFAALLSQFILEGHTLEVPQAISAACAWASVEIAERREWNVPASLVGAGLLLWLAAEELRPFVFSPDPQPFSRIPLESVFLSGPEKFYLSARAKLFLYASVVWALSRTGWSVGRAIFITGTLLLAGEWAQRWIPARTPELTDTALVCITGAMLWCARRFESAK